MSSKERISPRSTLVVHGVSSIKLSEGKASILGCPLSLRRRVLVRAERALPIYAETDVRLEIIQGEEARVERYEGNTIPESWAAISDEVIADRTKVMVIGKSDSGKSSFACYLANHALSRGKEVCVFDMDPGQATIGPPTMVSYANVSAPLYDPFTLHVNDATHVGYTSPSHAVRRCVNAAKDLFKKATRRSSPDLSIIDSDGWVEGIEAERYKAELIEACGIDAAVFIGITPNPPLLRKLMELNIEVSQIDKSAAVSSRGVNARKHLRSMGYRKYLKGARVRTQPTSWIRIDPLTQSPEASTQDYFQNVCSQVEQPSPSPKLRGSSADKDTGLLSYTYDGAGFFTGIGLVEDMDLKRNYIKIFTPNNGKIERVVLGRMILRKDGAEVYCVR